MEPLTGKQVRFLRSLGHHLKPLLQVGKEGVTDSFLHQLTQALDAHELIKVKVLQNAPISPKEAASIISTKLPCHIAQIIGKTLLIFCSRQENPEIVLP